MYLGNLFLQLVFLAQYMCTLSEVYFKFTPIYVKVPTLVILNTKHTEELKNSRIIQVLLNTSYQT